MHMSRSFLKYLSGSSYMSIHDLYPVQMWCPKWVHAPCCDEVYLLYNLSQMPVRERLAI